MGGRPILLGNQAVSAFSVDLSLTAPLSADAFVKRLITRANMCVGILFKIQLCSSAGGKESGMFLPSGLLFFKIMEIFCAFLFFCLSKKRLNIEMIIEAGCFLISV